MAPLGLTRWEAGGRPPWQRRRLPNCRIGLAGGIAVILRREGLYSSTLSDWRGLRDAGALGGLTSIKRGPKPALRNPLTAGLAQAKRENARLVRRLEQLRPSSPSKKVAELLGLPLATSDGDDAS